MNQATYAVGDPVRIASGTYKDAEGVIEDLQPECDVVRIHTKEGTAYGFLEDLMRVPLQPRTPPKRNNQRNPIRK